MNGGCRVDWPIVTCEPVNLLRRRAGSAAGCNVDALRLQLEHLGSTEATGSSKEPTLYTGGFGGLGVDLFEYSVCMHGGGSYDNLSKGTHKIPVHTSM